MFAEKPPKESQKLAYQQVERDDIPVVNPTTPGTTPIVNPTSPVPPITTGQPSTSQTALQAALDYACGYGGTDCSPIQPSRECWEPNTLVDHASYAFNDYCHKNPIPTSCVFGGAAQITNTDPRKINLLRSTITIVLDTLYRLRSWQLSLPCIHHRHTASTRLHNASTAPMMPLATPIVLAPPSPTTTFDPYTPGGDSGDGNYGPTGKPNSAGTATSSVVLLITCLAMPLSIASHI
ncbi:PLASMODESMATA CALLOSE-BINDING PROTEIN 3-like [Salvia divinorum]|uniref:PLASMODESMATA CALLOSE-BINDING PROTEIN 3-like n=1 Tax=Salvia divinorum TaxID=28513 RepID=A0ABD1G9J7_SALDI